MPLKFYYIRIFQLQSTSGVRNLCFLSGSQHITISDWVWTFLNLKFLGFKVWITFVILNHFFQSKINNHRFLFLFKITLHSKLGCLSLILTVDDFDLCINFYWLNRLSSIYQISNKVNSVQEASGKCCQNPSPPLPSPPVSIRLT